MSIFATPFPTIICLGISLGFAVAAILGKEHEP